MYMECSSKEMTGVHEIFDVAIDTAVRGGMQDMHGAGGEAPGSRAGTGGMTILNGKAVRRKKRTNCTIL
jgi:hypothetical protein